MFKKTETFTFQNKYLHFKFQLLTYYITRSQSLLKEKTKTKNIDSCSSLK